MIGQHFKESIDSLAVVDAAIRAFNVTMAEEMTDAGTDSWSKAVSPAAQAYSANSRGALMNTAPEDLRAMPVL